MSSLSGKIAEKVESYTIPPVDISRRLAGGRLHRHDCEVEGGRLARGPLPTMPVYSRCILRPGLNRRGGGEQGGEAQGRVGDFPDAAERRFLDFEGIDGFLILSTRSGFNSN